MSSRKFESELNKLPCGHEFIPAATPNKNAFTWSFFSVLESSLFAQSYFMTFAEAYCNVVEFIDFYNTRRIHGSIKMSPRDFETLWAASPQLQTYQVAA